MTEKEFAYLLDRPFKIGKKGPFVLRDESRAGAPLTLIAILHYNMSQRFVNYLWLCKDQGDITCMYLNLAIKSNVTGIEHAATEYIQFDQLNFLKP